MRRNGQSTLAAAMVWVHRVTSVSLEMALPAGVGYYLDQRWSTDPWLVILGALLGFSLGMNHLLQIAAASGQDSQ